MLTLKDITREFDANGVRYREEHGILALEQYSHKYNYSQHILMMIENGIFTIRFSADMVFQDVDMNLYEALNKFNGEYKYFTFFINDNGEVIFTKDEFMKEDNTVADVVKLIYSGIDILDMVYPELQRIRWSNR